MRFQLKMRDNGRKKRQQEKDNIENQTTSNVAVIFLHVKVLMER